MAKGTLNTWRLIWLILGIILSVTPNFSQKTTNKSRPVSPLTPRQIVSKVLPSLVVIFAQDKQGKTISQGSGFVYKPGLVATNLHVFERASGGFIKIPNSEKIYNIVAIVDMDFRRDICIIRIDDKSIPTLPLGDDKKLAVGDEVFAFGNPKGLEGSVSKGIVSSIRNDLGLIQIDAAISPGSSGGPIVNQQAEVIGIAVSTLVGGQNLNFSIPINYLLALKERFNSSVQTVGIMSVNDRENEQIKGQVKEYSQKYAEYNYDESTDKYLEEPSKRMVAKKVFNEFGNLIEETSFHYGEFSWKYSYFYDEKGFMTRRNYEDFEGKRESWQDSFDMVIYLKSSNVRLSGVHDSGIGTFVYDNFGKILESSLPTDSGQWRTVYSYDRNGFEIESKEYLNEKISKVRRYTYEIDSNGNWTKRFLTLYDSRWSSIGYVPTSVVYRDITYFE